MAEYKKQERPSVAINESMPPKIEDIAPKNAEIEEIDQVAEGDEHTLLPESEVKILSDQWLFLDIVTIPYRDLKLMPTIGQASVNGFISGGMVCYMNVVFQAIINMPGIKEYFLGNIHQKEAFADKKSTLGDCFVNRVGELVQIYHSYNDYILEPTSLSTIVADKSKQFGSFTEQHDAHELLTFMIDCLSVDLNRYSYPYQELSIPNCQRLTNSLERISLLI